MAGFFLAACNKSEDQAPPPQPTQTNSSTEPSLNVAAEYLGAVAQAKKSAVKTIDTVQINQAIQFFQNTEGHYPKDLKELVPDYLPKLPTPPYGMKFEYNAETGKVKVVPAR